MDGSARLRLVAGPPGIIMTGFDLGQVGYTLEEFFLQSELARLMAPTAEPMGIRCPVPVNCGPQHHYVAQAALAHLDRWARGGPPPPCSPLLAPARDRPG